MDSHRQLMDFFAITNQIDDLYTQLALQSGLSEAEHWTLYYIRQSTEGCTQKSICRQWSIRKQTVHSALKSLQKKGLIALQVSQEDRRSKQITLTPEGIAFAEKYLDPIFAAEVRAFTGMSEAARSALIQGTREYLTSFRKNLNLAKEQTKNEYKGTL